LRNQPFTQNHREKNMILQCPNCHSTRIDTKDIAKKTCGYIGMVSGAATTAPSVVGGAELGGTLGMIAGPAGAAVGIVAGSVLGALFGMATGGAVGAKLGEIIDEKVLDNYHCLACHYEFTQKTD
jgi:hypothetical protein